MNHSLTSGDVGPIRNSIDTSISNPFTKIPIHSDQHHHILLIDDEPLNNDYEHDDDDVSEAQLTIDCSYTRPFLFLDMIWNMSFVVVSVFVLSTSIQENPSTPLRFWVFGYALLCFFHVGFFWVEYRRWNFVDNNYSGGCVQDFRFRGVILFYSLFDNSIIKKLELINTIVSSIWWFFGFYWIVTGGQLLLQDSPRLYCLSVIFLAFDMFFLILCITMACIIFFVFFCCFPILTTIAYAMTISEGASENDIRSLPKYLYRQQSVIETFENDKKRDNVTIMTGTNLSGTELILQPGDSECCICLYKYVDGTELCRLPCNHHFHHECIAKWLRINATCPLCKFNILRDGDMLV